MGLMWCCWLGLLLTLAAVPARAAVADHPPFLPTRDVAVTYRVQGDGANQPEQARDVSVHYSAETARVRIDTPELGFLIADLDSKRVQIGMGRAHMYMELPFDPARAGAFMLNDRMTFAKRGSDTVVGLSCTVWDIRSERGSGSACITGDGVVLRAQGGGAQGAGSLLATSVKYGLQPASLFVPPPDYQKMEMPARIPGLAPPSGARPVE